MKFVLKKNILKHIKNKSEKFKDVRKSNSRGFYINIFKITLYYYDFEKIS